MFFDPSTYFIILSECNHLSKIDLFKDRSYIGQNGQDFFALSTPLRFRKWITHIEIIQERKIE